MSTHVKGTFDITISPQPPYDTSDGMTLSRVSIDKIFHGALEGSSRVDMLSALSAIEGSAGYVAIERVRGTLQGRAGSFVLQHSGTMARGKPTLTVSVVADSGTAELRGLTGEMKIEIIDGKHFYTFDYSIEDPPL
jgi:Protein of unknown function (DUF3224)